MAPPSAAPSKEQISAQLARISSSAYFRAAPLLVQILTILVTESQSNSGARLTSQFIGAKLGEEPAPDDNRTKEGYPKARANLQHVRKRLTRFYESTGYSDPVVILLPKGTYTPAIFFNPAYRSVEPLEPEAQALIRRIKMSLDLRSGRSLKAAMDYTDQLGKLSSKHPRLTANLLFVPLVAAPTLPYMVLRLPRDMKKYIEPFKAAPYEPWEIIFADACVLAYADHNWNGALTRFEAAITNSGGEAAFYWWYTALLASAGRINHAITILYSAIEHFARGNVAIRMDLAVLLIIAKRYSEAEEIIDATCDLVDPLTPAISLARCILYEAQDNIKQAAQHVIGAIEHFDVDHPERADWHGMLWGMCSLIAGREGSRKVASGTLGSLLKGYKKQSRFSSVEVALGLIGNNRLDDAVKHLEKSVSKQETDPYVMWLHIFPPLRHLRSNKRYAELLDKLGLRAGLYD